MGRDRLDREVSPDVVIDFDDVRIARGGSDLLRAVNWTVELDERWVVLGPNGAGKTTLLNLAAAHLHPTSGSVTVLGEQLGRTDVFELRTRVGLCTAAMADRIPRDELVHNVVVTGAWAVLGRFREQYDAMDEIRARVLLEQLGVPHLADRAYGTLSEGERKRVQIARALMADPELLLFDEPAAGLDLGGREELLRRLSELASDPDAPALVLVTHHVEEIPKGFTHGLLLSDGAVVEQGLIDEVVTSEYLSKAFGMSLTVQRSAGRYSARSM